MPTTPIKKYADRHETNSVQTNENDFLTERQLAERLNVSVNTLRNNRHLRKGIPHIKHGRSVRYCCQDIEEYIKSNRFDPKKI